MIINNEILNKVFLEVKDRANKLYQRLLKLGIKEDVAESLISNWIIKKLRQALDKFNGI